MSLAVGLLVGLLVGAGAAWGVLRYLRRRALSRAVSVRRIAFPFTGEGLSEPALVAALRVARAEGATLIPIYLALVPRDVPLDVPLTGQCEVALPLLEAIEHRAARGGVRVDSRIERGRSVRHALGMLLEHESFDRMVVASAGPGGGDGFGADDVAWLLSHVPAEVLVLRPAQAALAPGQTAAAKAEGAGAPSVPPSRGSYSPAG